MDNVLHEKMTIRFKKMPIVASILLQIPVKNKVYLSKTSSIVQSHYSLIFTDD